MLRSAARRFNECKSARSLIQTRSLFARGFASQGPYDVVVVGGGPGGYVAAIKAGQLGLKVACVEKRGTLGGTCLNVGCIPSKALLNASHHFHDANHKFESLGIDVENVKLNLPKMMETKAASVSGLTQGIEGLFKKNKVDYFIGHGKLTKANEVSVNDGEEVLTTTNVIIATGSEPASLRGIDVNQTNIVDSTGALDLVQVPKKMAVIGGGVIGLELGSVWSRLGAEVTVIEFLDRIIPGTDNEVAKNFQRILEKQGFKFMLKTKVDAAEQSGDGVSLKLSASEGGNEQTFDADVVLVSTGRRPYTENLGLEELGVKMDGLLIETDDHFKTSVPGVFAIGDVIKGPMLAHKAEEEGIAVVEMIKTGSGHVNYDAIPGVIYTHPEVATVGETEETLKAKGIKFNKGKFSFMANSRARTNNDADGFVKVLTDKETDRMLGMHIIGPNAGELIAEGVLGMEYGASAEDIARTCHAHPTLSEAVKEAAMAAYGKPIHS